MCADLTPRFNKEVEDRMNDLNGFLGLGGIYWMVPVLAAPRQTPPAWPWDLKRTQAAARP